MARSFTKNASIVIAMRWSERLLGLISMVVLARLLTPADFGLVAIAWLVIELLDLVTDLGVNVALIRKKDPDDNYYNTAWTMRLIQMLLAALVIFFSAGLFASFYSDHRLEPLLQVLSLFFLLGGIENIRIIDFQKNMDFGKDFIFFVARKLPTIIITIILAYTLKSYWALVIGAIIGKVISVAISYLLVRKMPYFCLKEWRNIFGVSQWVLLRSLLLYFDNNLPKILIGKLLNTEALGLYTLSAEIAAIPTTEVLAPINRVLFPALAKSIDDTTETVKILIRVFATQSYIALPAAFGICIISNDLVLVLLGSQWQSASMILTILAFASAITALSSCTSYLLLANGRLSILALVSFIQIIFFGAILYLFDNGLELTTIAYARLASTIFGFFCLLFLITKSLNQPFIFIIIKSIFRPLIASLSMFLTLQYFSFLLVDFNAAFRLVATIIVGAFLFIIFIYTLWIIGGKKDGPEQFLKTMLIRKTLTK